VLFRSHRLIQIETLECATWRAGSLLRPFQCRNAPGGNELPHAMGAVSRPAGSARVEAVSNTGRQAACYPRVPVRAPSSSDALSPTVSARNTTSRRLAAATSLKRRFGNRCGAPLIVSISVRDSSRIARMAATKPSRVSWDRFRWVRSADTPTQAAGNRWLERGSHDRADAWPHPLRSGPSPSPGVSGSQ